MLRFREAVDGGAIPFTVQGPENALCLDGGRTIGWEIAERLDADEPHRLDAIFVQVGGGAFAACLGAGLVEAGHRPRLMAVQAAGCAPLDVCDVCAGHRDRLHVGLVDPGPFQVGATERRA